MNRRSRSVRRSAASAPEFEHFEYRAWWAYGQRPERREVSSDMETTEPHELGFAADIRPLFRETDRNAMRGAFDLWGYADVVAHGQAIAQRLGDGTMPCDGAWPSERVDLFRPWLAEGAAE